MNDPIETSVYRAATGALYRLQLFRDQDPVAPWDAGDCLPPIAYTTGGRGIEERDGDGRGESVMPSLSGASPEQLRKVADAIGADWIGLVSDACHYFGCYSIGARASVAERLADIPDPGTADPAALPAEVLDRVADALDEGLRYWSGSGSDRLEAIAATWRALGVAADVFPSQGYSQSCYADILVVLHPAWIARVGWAGDDAAAQSTMKATAREVGAYFWGDVVGYVVERVDPRELEIAGLDPGSLTAGQAASLAYCAEVGSCWGFYPGDDADEWAYVWDEAEAEAEHDARELEQDYTAVDFDGVTYLIRS